jgi:hypothetical protein
VASVEFGWRFLRGLRSVIGFATSAPLPAEPDSDVVRRAAPAITTPTSEPELELFRRLVRTPGAATCRFNSYGLLRLAAVGQELDGLAAGRSRVCDVATYLVKFIAAPVDYPLGDQHSDGVIVGQVANGLARISHELEQCGGHLIEGQGHGRDHRHQRRPGSARRPVHRCGLIIELRSREMIEGGSPAHPPR